MLAAAGDTDHCTDAYWMCRHTEKVQKKKSETILEVESGTGKRKRVAKSKRKRASTRSKRSCPGGDRPSQSTIVNYMIPVTTTSEEEPILLSDG